MRSGCRILAGLAMLPWAASAAAQDAPSIVRRAGSTYRSLTSLQADFAQVIEDTGLGDTLKTTGRLYQAGPNAFAMRFTDPPDDAIVVDGTWVWVYTPSSAPGQVLRTRMDTDPVYGANLLARVLDRPADRYRSRLLRQDVLNGRRVDVVEIVPRTGSVNFSSAVLWLDQEDALPRRIELEESPGVRRILTLTRLRPNTPVNPELLKFQPPKGVRIIDQ